MIKRLTIPANKFDETNIDYRIISYLVHKHMNQIAPLLEKNKRYYDGEHDILFRKRQSQSAPNSRVVCNHAAYIADTSSSYFMGSPIKYTNTDKVDIEPLLIAFDKAYIDDIDMQHSLNMAIYGVSYEYEFVKKNTNEINVKVINPAHTFIVYDDSIEENPLFAVYYRVVKDDSKDSKALVANIFTQNFIYEYVVKGFYTNDMYLYTRTIPDEHYMGDIPIVEFRNNIDGTGDYEKEIGLIDAYNTLMSDRIDDVEKFVDSIMVIYSDALLQDENTTNGTSTMALLKKEKLLQLSPDDKAEFLTSSLDGEGMETMRKAIKEDIFTLAQVPNLADENFASNSSGVAMKYKLLGLENLTNKKERFYREGLRKRIKNFCYYLKLTSIEMESESIIPTFTRSLPQNIVELSNIVSALEGQVSSRTLLTQLPFIEDIEKEIEELAKEKAENIENNKKFFGVDTDPLNDTTEDEENEKVLENIKENKQKGEQVEE